MDDLQQVAQITSFQGGQTDVMLVAVFAICQALDPASPLANQILRALEQSYAPKLLGSTNPHYLEGFEQTMALLKEALSPQQDG